MEMDLGFLVVEKGHAAALTPITLVSQDLHRALDDIRLAYHKYASAVILLSYMV